MYTSHPILTISHGRRNRTSMQSRKVMLFQALRSASALDFDLENHPLLSLRDRRRPILELQRAMGSSCRYRTHSTKEDPSGVSHHTSISTKNMPSAITTKIKYPPLRQPNPTVGVKSGFDEQRARFQELKPYMTRQKPPPRCRKQCTPR